MSSTDESRVFVLRDFFKAFLYLQYWFPAFTVLLGIGVWTSDSELSPKVLFSIFIVLAEGLTFARSVRIATDSRKDGTMWKRIRRMRDEEYSEID